ncbi:MAG: addiction module protein [Chitinophagaceae bacterium]|nr:addiction module protein [Chitinophagaceae bacterium]MCW5904395.1 addiction module protein [Chitinophagaceae bacterium]
MSYDIKELLALPEDEKVVLANTLWDSISKNNDLTKDEIAFIEQRLKEHEENPDDVITWEEIKEKINNKYGF